MKRVAVVLNTMNFGGVAKSLIDFLNLLKNDCNIDLFLFRDDGDLIDQIPKGVNIIIPKGYMGCFVECSKECKKLGLVKYFFRRFMRLCCLFTHNYYPFVGFATRHSQKFKGYDVAVSYAKVCPPDDVWCGAAEFVLNNIKAKKKYVVNHDDYMKENFTKTTLKKIKKFDTMFVVSQGCMNRILDNEPELKSKTDYMYNPVNTALIIEKAKEKNDHQFDNKKIQLVITGRLATQKNHTELLNILSEVKSKIGDKFVLNILGDGSLRENLEKQIMELNLKNNVKIWGFQKNPYAIIKNCDLSLLYSIWESFGIVYVESMVLGVPVLTNNVTPAKEIVEKYGVVAENADDFKNELARLITDKNYLDFYKNKVKNYNYDNEIIKEKWLKYINGEKND